MGEVVLPTPGPHMVPKLEHPARHIILRMGRRWRKTTLGVTAAICGRGPIVDKKWGRRLWPGVIHGANVWFVDQSFPDATSVWDGVKKILTPVQTRISERDRRIEVHGGGAITIKSAAKPKGLVGDWRGIDAVILNEAAKYQSIAWELLRPTISDTKGWTLWPTTPEGYNFFKKIDDNAAPAAAMDAEWAKWHEPSFANPFWDPAEIEKSRKDGMPERMIQQEYYAKFVLWGAARTYYEFESTLHVQAVDLSENDATPLDLCVSFKVAPAAWMVCQGAPEAGQYDRVIGEIRTDADDVSVRAYVEEFRRQFPDHARGENLRVFGDASPAAGGGKSTAPSDFEFLRAAFPNALFRVRAKSMPDKDRVNAVNNVLKDQAGKILAAIDPSCTGLIKDLEHTRNDESSFQIDRQPGIGQYAHAWSSKLLWVAPLLASRLPRAAPDPAEKTRSGNWKESTPEARRAQAAVYRAVRSGRVVRPTQCEQCRGDNDGKPMEGAHSSYDPGRELDVRWLCRKCHLVADLQNPKGGLVHH